MQMQHDCKSGRLEGPSVIIKCIKYILISKFLHSWKYYIAADLDAMIILIHNVVQQIRNRNLRMLHQKPLDKKVMPLLI